MMTDRLSEIPRGLRVTILITKIVGTLFAAFLIFMMIGYAVNPQGESGGGLPDEWLLMIFFPIGLCVGYLISWRWTLIGGIISIGCIVVFLIAERQAVLFGVMALLGAPAVVLIICGWLKRRYMLDMTSN
jgi:hypothetical protein